MATNQLLPFCNGDTPNVIDFDAWNALPSRLTGFQSGIAKSAEFNRIFAQGGAAGYVIGQMVVDYALQDAGLNATALYAAFKDAVAKYVPGAVADGSINGSKITNGTVSKGKMAAGSVGTEQLVAGSVTAEKLGTGSVTSEKLGAASVTDGKIGANAINTANIKDAQVTLQKMAAGAVGTDTIVNGSVTKEKLAADSVDATKIVDGSVGTTELADGSVTSEKLGDGSVADGKIGANAVNAANIKDGNVTEPKIGAGAVTNGKIGAKAVTFDKMADAAIATVEEGKAGIAVDKLMTPAATKAAIGAQLPPSVPPGVMVAFAGQTIPDGWLICNGAAVSRTTYANLFAAIGTTYGAGDGSTTFNLPNPDGRVLQATTDVSKVGQKLEAGLPNITGSHFREGYTGTATWSGCFYKGSESSAYYGSHGSGSRAAATLMFSGNSSNSLYGNSNTVQMPAGLCVFIIRSE